MNGILEAGIILFQEDIRLARNLESSEVQIRVSGVGINKEDSLVVSGTDDATTFSHEIAGVITKIGSAVTNVAAGEKVVAFSFDTLATTQRTRASLVQRINESASFQHMASLPIAFGAALYGH